MRPRSLAYLLLVSFLCIGTDLGITAQGPQSVAVRDGLNAVISFNRDIRPILSNSCFRCHGPDSTSRMVGMRLDLREEATKPRANGTPIVPGKPDESLLIKRIFEPNPNRRMPPLVAHRELTDAQKDTIRRWIAQGAEYEGHWAYQALRRPAIPTVGGVSNPIDAFVRARLEQAGLRPSPEADRRTLLRRVTLDLTGLAPSPAEVDAFVADRSPNAYDKVVDRLISSPRYAERQAVHWLDAVRFADTSGFHGDSPYPTWPYRDYVLKAFRDNIPFDRFTREQLAGDLLPSPTQDQLIASAYNRLNRVSAEVGLQEKEYLARYATDRVSNVSTVWMATTMYCAECHDHKFDPVKAKDFYTMKSFFADIEEDGLARDLGNLGLNLPQNWGPKLALPTSAQSTELAELEKRIGLALQRLTQETASLADQQRSWEADILARYNEGALAWRFQRPVAATAKSARLRVRDDLTIRIGNYQRNVERPATGIVVADGPNPDTEVYSVTLKPGVGTWKSLGLEAERDDSLAGGYVARGANGAVISEIEVEVSRGDGKPSRRVRFSLAYGITLASVKEGIFAVDGDPKTEYTVLGGSTANPFLAMHFAEPLTTDADATLVIRIRQESRTRRAALGRFRLALSPGTAWPEDLGRGGLGAVNDTAVDPKEDFGLPKTLVRALGVAQEMRTPEDSTLIREYFQMASPQLAPLWVEAAKLEAARDQLQIAIPKVVVAHSIASRETKILPRGNWMDESGEVVGPAIPAFLGTLRTGEKRPTRLDLANWLVSPENPLTARVYVNRIWKDFFGTGISKTVEDFGSQGEWPTHLELLDWLASEFMQPQFSVEGTHAWDMRHMVRTIVTSETYKQSSLTNPALDEADPDNRLLARQNRFRVDAEVVHDVALQASGLLVEKFGGPSVKPYQPEGYFAALTYPKREYSASHGEDLYRRSVYTYWQRTFLHPDLLSFDAPSREECALNRIRSNTPMQALNLLNDPIYVEAARAFAQNVLTSGGPSLPAQLQWAFRQALGRSPDATEVKTLSDVYASNLKRFTADRTLALKLIHVGESAVASNLPPTQLAAMTTVTRVLLNLSEVITRD